MFNYLLLICLVPIAIGNEISQANNVFANELYKHLVKPNSNLVFSPLGIYAMLALLYQAATGRTETMLSVAMALPDKNATADQYRDILIILNENRANLTLHIANKIYIETGFQFVEKFERISRDYFGTSFISVQFGKGLDVEKEVNAWFSNITKGDITNFDEMGDLSRLTTILMLSAFYFRGLWTARFTSNPNMPLPFYLSRFSTIYTDCMRSTDRFGYYEDEDLDAKWLKIDFINRRYSATFILPNSRAGINDVEAKLHDVNVNSAIESMEMKKVDVAIPKFNFKDSFDLEETLRALGLDDLYDKDDLTDLTDGNLRADKLMHKAVVLINEKGASTSSATENDDDGISDRPLFTFIADRPFIFTINVDLSPDSDYLVLFMGKVYNPNDV